MGSPSGRTGRPLGSPRVPAVQRHRQRHHHGDLHPSRPTPRGKRSAGDRSGSGRRDLVRGEQGRARSAGCPPRRPDDRSPWTPRATWSTASRRPSPRCWRTRASTATSRSGRRSGREHHARPRLDPVRDPRQRPQPPLLPGQRCRRARSRPVRTTLADASISDFDPDYPYAAHSWFRIDLNPALPNSRSPIALTSTATRRPAPSAQHAERRRQRLDPDRAHLHGRQRELPAQQQPRPATWPPAGRGALIRGLAINRFGWSGIMVDPGADGIDHRGELPGHRRDRDRRPGQRRRRHPGPVAATT